MRQPLPYSTLATLSLVESYRPIVSKSRTGQVVAEQQLASDCWRERER